MKIPYIATVVVLSVLLGVVADRLVVATAVRAQDTARINIGGESVFIGMPKDAALAKFAGKYGIGDLQDGRVAITKSYTEPKIVRSVGVLSFEDGKLTAATRYWGDFWDGTDDKMEPFWHALRGAMAQQIGARRIAVEMESSSHEQPGSQEEWISIHFAKRDIEIGKHHVRVNNRDGRNFYVRETVF